MPKTTYAVVLGSQRSGTTAIGYVIGAAKDTKYLGEVFHHIRGPQDDADYEAFHVVPEANFFSFREALYARFPAVSFPTGRSQRSIWSLFLEQLRHVAGTPMIVIDLKYNSLHHLNTVWHGVFDRPFILKLLSEDKAPIVHVVRKDLFAQAVSLHKAQKTGIWHRESGQAFDETAVELNPSRLLDEMNRILHSRSFVTRMLQYHTGPVLQLEYEDAFDASGRLASGAATQISEVIGAEVKPAKPPIRKLASQPLHQVLSNPEEILTFFTGKPFEDEVRRHLAQG